MARQSTKYVCQQCGYESSGWLGKCPNCGSWNSLVETIVEETRTGRTGRKSSTAKKTEPISLSSVSSKKTSRISTKIPELDRVLGGGLVDGQVILIAGEPGIGKSTLLLQLSHQLGGVLYVCGEESASQIKVRAERLGIKKDSIFLLEETDVDNIISTVELMTGELKTAKNKNSQTVQQFNSLSVIIIDSIQALSTSDLSGTSGSVGQVRECAARLAQIGKEKGIPVFLVGHVTKEGAIAGPRVLEHLVDTVLWIEGERSGDLRIVRAVKNRFGATDEVGIFKMGEKGLSEEKSIDSLFIESAGSVAGSSITVILEGTRPILVEVQALVVPTKLTFPKRISYGFDARRLEVLLATLVRRAGIPIQTQDVFVNVVGGILTQDRALDLAVAISIVSSFKDKPPPSMTIVIGEVGLLGEVREVQGLDRRIKFARQSGFRSFITKKEVRTIVEAIRKSFK